MQIFVASDHRGFELKGRICAFLARAPYLKEPREYPELVGDIPRRRRDTSESFTASTPVKVVDLGPNFYDKNDDYNDAARAVARAVLTAKKVGKDDPFGILICGSAIGISIQANRFKGIRAAVVHNLETAESSRSHNDANVLCLSADQLTNAQDPLESEAAYEDLYAIIEKFLTTPFSDEERHKRRIKRLDEEVNKP